MDAAYTVGNTSEDDLEFIYWMFEEAMLFQKQHGYTVWKGYDTNVLTGEAREKTQYKIVINGSIALIFSVVYNDELLWCEREKGDAIYLHRIVVNPRFRGMKLFGEVLKWAITHAREQKRKFVRMDTWGDNPKIIRYYEGYGFRFTGNYTTPDIPELPAPHRNSYLALLELEISETEKKN